MFCGECGSRNPDSGDICTNCGKLLRRSTSVIHPSTVTPQTKKQRNWAGIISILCGILSWGILTMVLAVVAIALGVFSLYIVHRETGKIAFSAVAGIVIASAAIFVSLLIA